ncbi:MerR family transcriptional regulator [Variovorax sp. LT1R16]|uniref:MerR family transcriptional regulator n=1 Tax=Variovorax sp. LT1R16 TaxID=3443728 RepID=UPI003F470DE0
MQLKIGELARRTGLTVRTLHHYDDIGLLKPAARSESGYRLYGREDIARLYRIQALRRLDVSLGDIAALLDDEAHGIGDIVARQLNALERQIRQASALRDHLLALQAQVRVQAEPSMDEWLVALEGMVAGTKYFSDAERARLNTPAAEAQRQHKAALTATLQALMRAGAAPDGIEAIDLARQWIAMLLDEAQGDEGLLMKLYAMHWHEPGLRALTGVDQAGMRFISLAMAHHRLSLYAPFCSVDEMALLRRHYVDRTDDWPALVARVRDCLQRGVAANSLEMRALAADWQALSLAKAGGDAALQAKLQTAFAHEPALRRGSGIDTTLTAYVGEAIRASNFSNHRPA